MAPTRTGALAIRAFGAFAACSLLHAGPAQAETRALLIGIGAYSGLPAEYRLAAPAHDMGRLTSSLVAAGVPLASIQTVSDARRGEGDRRVIVASLNRLLDQTRAGDRILLYYSGHGGQRIAAYPEHEADGLEEVWLAGDARIGLDGAPQGGVITDYEIIDIIGRLTQRGADVWLVVDACYAGGVTRGAVSGGARIKSVGGLSRSRARGAGRQAGPLRGDDAGLVGADPRSHAIAGPGHFSAFYAAGAGDLALATASGSVFTSALARSLDSGRVGSLRDLTAAILSADARTGADAPRPVFEGDLDLPVLDLTVGRPRRFGLSRSRGRVFMTAGGEEGVEAGATIALEAAGGGDLGTAVVDRVALGTARLAGDVPQGAVAARLNSAPGRGHRPSERVLSAIEALGGAWTAGTLDIGARLERPAPGACTDPVDPETPGPDAAAISLINPPPLRNCDRLYLSLVNRGTTALDVSLLYLAADGSVVGPSLHPIDEVRLRPGERRDAAIRIMSEPEPVIERLAVVAMPATSRFPLDLRYLATPPVRGVDRDETGPAEGYARWWRIRLASDAIRGAENAERPGPVPVAIAFPLRIVP